ncbi:diguanylate cyclase/phosphodiesterase (GGDEF & EAL domains) with PAS/PAC sensor(s) [Vibrio sp. RC586]|uniref:EAL domain-containing response regulator n=1 Tax=Vibrio sp. RC586 TaxID=675815 RepID=UPI0001BB7DAE|nr:EAL domain-containing protein [Vibrio sp. RC586]EEZ00476.1 diguanylate cyclase/phosphodiesterase (GGDEF & EAL domains) with PAS/PAC sensor(s) [Vibrio sp. RC586]
MYASREILLVDDEPAVLNALKRELRPYFPNLYTATCAQEALEVLKQHSIQMVISDYRMPGMNGADLVIEINRHYPQIMSLILSGQADMDGLSRALNEGELYKFLLKPWDRTYLLQTILQCFSEKERQQEFNSITGLKTQSALDKQISLLQSLREQPYLILVMEWPQSLTESQRHSISQQLNDVLPDVDNLYQDGSCWFWVMHRLTPWYQSVFKLLDHFENTLLLAATNGVRWWLTDMESWSDAVLKSHHSELDVPSLFENFPLYWLGKTSDVDEIKQLLGIYRDLLQHRFCAFYQPQKSMISGDVIAFEALARRELGRGLYEMPARFFPILEKYHLIPDLTEVMVRDILTFLMAEESILSDITVGVNIPGTMLTDGSCYRLIVDLAKQHGAEQALHRLSVEITEHDLIADFDAAKHEIYKLKSLGIRCALDDFGTGYSGYEYLCEIPFDVVKIDGRFIQSLGKSDSSTVILNSMISSIKSLSMQVIAEWVDSEPQYHILKEMGCDMVQGYLVSPAIAPEQVLKYLDKEREGRYANG